MVLYTGNTMALDDFMDREKPKYSTYTDASSELESISTVDEGIDAIRDFIQTFNRVPKTYSDWNEHMKELGYSTSAPNFTQNTGINFSAVMEMAVEGDNLIACNDCGKRFSKIGRHLSQSNCEYYSIDEYTMELLTGLWLSDGWIAHSSNDRYILHVEMTNKKFLEWFKQSVNIPTSDVKLRSTAEESAERAVESGIVEQSNHDDYAALYRLNTIAHPDLAMFSQMSKTEVNLTPTISKMWYCGDGSVHWVNGFSFVQITISKTIDEIMQLTDQLDKQNIDTEIDSIRNDGKVIRFNKNQSEQFLEWIGPAPPGFEYKWELDDRDKYNRLRSEVRD